MLYNPGNKEESVWEVLHLSQTTCRKMSLLPCMEEPKSSCHLPDAVAQISLTCIVFQLLQMHRVLSPLTLATLLSQSQGFWGAL